MTGRGRINCGLYDLSSALRKRVSLRSRPLPEIYAHFNPFGDNLSTNDTYSYMFHEILRETVGAVWDILSVSGMIILTDLLIKSLF